MPNTKPRKPRPPDEVLTGEKYTNAQIMKQYGISNERILRRYKAEARERLGIKPGEGPVPTRTTLHNSTEPQRTVPVKEPAVKRDNTPPVVRPVDKKTPPDTTPLAYIRPVENLKPEPRREDTTSDLLEEMLLSSPYAAVDTEEVVPPDNTASAPLIGQVYDVYSGFQRNRENTVGDHASVLFTFVIAFIILGVIIWMR